MVEEKRTLFLFSLSPVYALTPDVEVHGPQIYRLNELAHLTSFFFFAHFNVQRESFIVNEKEEGNFFFLFFFSFSLPPAPTGWKV